MIELIKKVIWAFLEKKGNFTGLHWLAAGIPVVMVTVEFRLAGWWMVGGW